MELKNLDHLITKYKLTNYSEEIHALACPSLRLLATPVEDRQPVGTSRLGGQPDLPAGFPWPEWKDRPMSFLAQICLEDIAGFAPAEALPSSGLLSFFYDSRQETYGASPDDRGGWAVSFFEPAIQLSLAPFPDGLPREARFKPLGLKYHREWTLPVDPRQAKPGLELSDSEQRAYENLLRDFFGPGDRKIPHHRMFGWPDQLQDDMQLQAALAANNIRDRHDPREKEAAQTKSRWVLLLQVDSDERAGMRWGSYGMIYDWIEEEALKERVFNQTWMILQSD
jgi:uncharacterized protein YwqG